MTDNTCRDLYDAISGLRQRPGDQPLPTEGKQNVQDALIEHIKKRRELGVQRYGRPLQTFNGRNAILDLVEELLDGATYAMQVEMESKATQARIHEALNLHRANSDGTCTSCREAAPCRTRNLFLSWQQPLTFSTVHPIEEIAVHPDSLAALKDYLKLNGVEERVGFSIGEYFGIPIVNDPGLEPNVVRMRPHRYDAHPTARPQEG